MNSPGEVLATDRLLEFWIEKRPADRAWLEAGAGGADGHLAGHGRVFKKRLAIVVTRGYLAVGLGV